MEYSGKKGSVLIKVLLGVLALLIVVYLAGAFFFIGHFRIGTEINHTDVAFKDESAVEELLSEKAGEYSLTITGRDGKGGVIGADDVGLKAVFDGTIGEILDEQNAFLWPIGLFNKDTYNTDEVTEFDEGKLKNALDALGLFNGGKAPVDARLSDFKEGGYEIIPDEAGSTLLPDKVYAAANEAVGSLAEELDLDKEGCYKTAVVRADDPELNAYKDKLNRYASLTFTIPFGDQNEVLDGKTIGEWIDINEDDVTLDESKVKEYVDSLARKYDTFGVSRSFQTTERGTITVTGGNYGWWTDRPSTTTELIAAIKEGKGGEFTPVYFSEATKRGDSDIGNSYVEVDLDNQRVYCYKDGKLVVTSDCVSGKVSAGHFTPDGTYAITYKQRDATLVGQG
ncbi:MAG: L,D-transpeptidase/peptidoglycan binding protein, partial [Lachnospiraceae bacterium]|nr:L,D-transpeptidase/peptidoglycan binding protein [Lachnospiraceae bacterium]